MKIFLAILAMVGILIAAIAVLFAIGLIALGVDKLRQRYHWVATIWKWFEKISSILAGIIVAVIIAFVIFGSFISVYSWLWK